LEFYVGAVVVGDGVGAGGFHVNPNIAPTSANMNPITNPLHVNMLSIDNMRATIDHVLTVDGTPVFIFVEAMINNIPNTRPIAPRATTNAATGASGAIDAIIAAATVDAAKSIIPFININIPPINTKIYAAVGFSPIINTFISSYLVSM